MAKSLEYRYASEIYANLGFWPTWTPLQPLELGAVGRLKGYRFERHASLADFGIEHEVVTGSTGPQAYGTRGAYRVEPMVGATLDTGVPTLPQARAAFTVRFHRAWGVVLSLMASTQAEISNRHVIERRLADVDDWDSRWTIITSVVRAEAVTVLMSQTNGSSVELVAEADVPATIVGLGDVGANLTLSRSDEMAYVLVGEGPCTPLFRAERRPGRLPGLRYKGPKDAEELQLVPVSPEEVGRWYPDDGEDR